MNPEEKPDIDTMIQQLFDYLNYCTDEEIIELWDKYIIDLS